MPTWSIVLLSIIVFVGLMKIVHKVTKKSRLKREKEKKDQHINRVAKWKAGDELIVWNINNDAVSSDIYDTAEENLNNPRTWSEGVVQLVKWSEDEIIYECENGQQFFGQYHSIRMNKSASHRYRIGKMDNFMEDIDDLAKFREKRLSELLDKEKEESTDD
ncbi:MAG: hypothetical protein SLAVMIC_00777 [uncultured marine phage]|uniref:Uncharacterized protein n=1 Tax=uncultured marine phage TaxID=707152 RepID=A0A8D9FRD3_9VIRU|nr:MAG: hypothetical protein SLAVMIC_00777 [uncultured marine phage]